MLNNNPAFVIPGPESAIQSQAGRLRTAGQGIKGRVAITALSDIQMRKEQRRWVQGIMTVGIKPRMEAIGLRKKTRYRLMDKIEAK